jgi:hypothetical protein
VATVLKVSEKQWVKVGLPANAYKTILAKGFSIVWKQGGGFSIYDLKQEQYWGFAKIKGDEIFPDAVFKGKYKELTGVQFLAVKEVTDLADLDLGVAAPISATKPASALSPEKVGQIKAGVNLTNVEDVGVYVKGTSANYRVYLVSDDCNIAFRLAGGQLAIRVEKFTPAAKKELAGWGVEMNKVTDDGRAYGSCHLNVGSPEMARRTLGSLAASVLSKTPTKLLAKDKVL